MFLLRWLHVFYALGYLNICSITHIIANALLCYRPTLWGQSNHCSLSKWYLMTCFSFKMFIYVSPTFILPLSMYQDKKYITLQWKMETDMQVSMIFVQNMKIQKSSTHVVYIYVNTQTKVHTLKLFISPKFFAFFVLQPQDLNATLIAIHKWNTLTHTYIHIYRCQTQEIFHACLDTKHHKTDIWLHTFPSTWITFFMLQYI